MGGSKPSSQDERDRMYMAIGGLAAVGAGLYYYVNREVSDLSVTPGQDDSGSRVLANTPPTTG